MILIKVKDIEFKFFKCTRGNMYRTSKILLSIFVCSILFACVSGDDRLASKADARLLKGLWRVEDIDQAGVIDYSMVTLQFVENSRIAGTTGCNRYAGNVETEDGAFVVSKVSSTRRACVPATANQEQRFLSALSDANHYEIEAETWLNIYDESNQLRLQLIKMSSASAPGPQGIKVDRSQAQRTNFQCKGIGTVSFHFLGPETVELSMDQQVFILQRISAASGAQYSSEDMTLWNKGKEALLSLNGREYKCVQKSQ